MDFLAADISSGLGAIGVDLTPAGKGAATAPSVGETTGAGAGAGALAVTGAATPPALGWTELALEPPMA